MIVRPVLLDRGYGSPAYAVTRRQSGHAWLVRHLRAGLYSPSGLIWVHIPEAAGSGLVPLTASGRPLLLVNDCVADLTELWRTLG